MPSQLALLFCILFVGYAFKLDFKKKPQVSSALWIPLIWMMIAGSRPVSYWWYMKRPSANEFDITSGDSISRTVLILLIILGLNILSKRKLAWGKIFKSNIWFVIFFIYMALSIFWSEYTNVSFKRLIRVFGDIVMVLVVLSEHDTAEAIKTMFRRFSYVIIPFSIICSKYFPAIGQQHNKEGIPMWVGVTTQKNTLGLVACLSASFLVWNMISKQRNKMPIQTTDILLLFLSLFLLFWGVASSATAIGIFFIGICAFQYITKFESNPKALGTVNIMLMSGAFLTYLLASEFIFGLVLNSADRDMTLTGRTFIWEELINLGSQNSLLGSGFGAFWLGDNMQYMWDRFSSKPTQAHCGYLDVWLNLGWMGLIFFVLVTLSSYKNITNLIIFNFEYGRLRFVLFIMILIHNITESSFLRGTNLLWFLFILVVLVIPEDAKRHRLLSTKVVNPKLGNN